MIHLSSRNWELGTCYDLRRDKTKEAYQFEVSCVGRMRTEIIHLRALVNSQQHLINQLVSENKDLRQDKYTLRKFEIYMSPAQLLGKSFYYYIFTEKDFLEFKLSSLKGEIGDGDGKQKFYITLLTQKATSCFERDVYMHISSPS